MFCHLFSIYCMMIQWKKSRYSTMSQTFYDSGPLSNKMIRQIIYNFNSTAATVINCFIYIDRFFIITSYFKYFLKQTF